uniref:Reverse transcriptase/retrotransposon-derived protein RNase H-like domain-containing protein n=1 Tax=Acanthochromis polyacanthus TaxID=80966 RepID=A0A3Q1EJS4_9TELE
NRSSTFPVRFLGHLIDETGTRPHPDKVTGIENFPQLQNVTELEMFLGRVNYLTRYVPELSSVGRPLYDLLKTKMEWLWGPAQLEPFQKLKAVLDATKPTVISADANSYGLGGVFFQEHGDHWKTIAYSQIEKKCLASVWTWECFQEYLLLWFSSEAQVQGMRNDTRSKLSFCALKYPPCHIKPVSENTFTHGMLNN